MAIARSGGQHLADYVTVTGGQDGQRSTLLAKREATPMSSLDLELELVRGGGADPDGAEPS